MKKLMKRNQVIIAALAIMIVVAGYLNLTRDSAKPTGAKVTPTDAAKNDGTADPDSEGAGNFVDISDGDSIPVADDGSLILAENQKVSTTPAPTPGSEDSKTDASNPSQTGDDTPGNSVLASTELTPDYFVSAKLSREQIRAKNREALMAIVQDSSISEELKADAMKTLVNMTKNAEKEDICESLLEAKGFQEIVVHIEEDSVNVTVNAASITQQEVAQIEDIIIRETGVKVSQIYVQHAVTSD